MADYFRKTERGRREVRERSANLSRSARNLLLILDSSKSLGTWVGMINGATLADGVALLEAGLIEPQEFSGGPETRPVSFEPTEPLDYDQWLQHTAPNPMHAPTEPAALALDPPPARRSAPEPRRRREEAQALAQVRLAVPIDPPAPIPPPAPALPAEPDGMPSSLMPEDTAGFVPLDGHDLPAGSTGLGYTELYDSLNALLRETLGLFRGYRYTLRIERAQNIAELEAVAREFVLEVQRLRGDSRARMVQRALGLGG